MPTLQDGDVVILDNLENDKNETAAQCLKQRGASFYSCAPLCPIPIGIEQAASKI